MKPRTEPSSQSTAWMSRVALAMILIIVAARATMTQQLRDPFEVQPGSLPAPRVLGAAGSVVLDLLACLPAILILVRAAVDKRFILRFSTGHILGLLLAAWIAASTIWATDRFAAAIEATHWTAAMVLLWSVSQLVRSWLQLRLVGAVCLGLMVVLVADGLVYRFVEVPDDRDSFLQNEQRIYKERGWTADSFIAQQFKRKVMGGEIIGFSASTNTYAMLLVLLGIVAVGLIAQRISDRDEWGWAIGMSLGVGAMLVTLWLTKCRAALATPIIAAMILLVLSRRNKTGNMVAARRAYWIGVSGVVLIIAAVIGHGLYHGSLVHDSLTFRWRYWIGSMRLWMTHPIFGVGFANFGEHYLAFRLPIASEEIKDPHNFFVRILVECGLIGALMLIVWMLRIWWEMVRPRGEVDEEFARVGTPLSTFLGLAAGAMLLNVLASVDFSQSGSFVFIEVLKRFLWLVMLFVGLVVGGLRSKRLDADDRPAPWIRWAILASLAAFLVHNSIEFGLFETAPLFLFALLAGSAMGVGATDRPAYGAWSMVVTASLIWIVIAFAWVVPVVMAESAAERADDALQANRPDEAEQGYTAAIAELPLSNADYAVKRALAMMYAREPRQKIEQALNVAVADDPAMTRAYLTRARFQIQFPDADQTQTRADFQKAVDLNPNDVDIRLDYADALQRFGLKQEAAEQIQAALDKNAGLSPDEPKRLSVQQVAEAQQKILALRSRSSQ